jgi:hypothetical protein
MENELIVMLFESKRFELVDRQRDRSIYLPTDTTILNFPGRAGRDYLVAGRDYPGEVYLSVLFRIFIHRYGKE